MFQGSLTALITPFDGEGLDEQALVRLVRHQIDNGTNGLVPVGTTGESPTLSPQEHRRVIEIVCAETAGEVPVLAGAGSNSTAEAVAMTQAAAQLGAQGTLHAVGYYNKPSQQGIIKHFEAVCAASDLPVVVYNIPPRSVVDITPQTMATLASFDQVVGVKDATADLARPLLERALIDKPFNWLSGEDATAVAYNANGGTGCISVTANVAPALCAQLQAACQAKDYVKALAIQDRLMPLHHALFAEPSPAGIKHAVSRLGIAQSQCRLPMLAASAELAGRIDAIMAELAL